MPDIPLMEVSYCGDLWYLCPHMVNRNGSVYLVLIL